MALLELEVRLFGENVFLFDVVEDGAVLLSQFVNERVREVMLEFQSDVAHL